MYSHYNIQERVCQDFFRRVTFGYTSFLLGGEKMKYFYEWLEEHGESEKIKEYIAKYPDYTFIEILAEEREEAFKAGFCTAFKLYKRHYYPFT